MLNELPLEIIVRISSFLDGKSLLSFYRVSKLTRSAALFVIKSRIKYFESMPSIRRILDYKDYTSIFLTVNLFLAKCYKTPDNVGLIEKYIGLHDVFYLHELSFCFQVFLKNVFKSNMGSVFNFPVSPPYTQELVYGFKFSEVLMPRNSLSIGLLYYPYPDYFAGKSIIKKADIKCVPRAFYMNLRQKTIKVALRPRVATVFLGEEVKHLEFGYNCNINENSICQFIPKNLFFYLPNLRLLSFRGCNLHAVPQILLDYIELELLDLSRNKISKIDCKIHVNNRLKHLNLSQNKLSDLPAELSKLNNLVYFGLSKNKIKTVAPNLKLLLTKTHNYGLLNKI